LLGWEESFGWFEVSLVAVACTVDEALEVVLVEDAELIIGNVGFGVKFEFNDGAWGDGGGT